METFDVLINRRSIRKYKKLQIENKKIDLILKAAMYAPSAMNLQPWHFLVFDNNEIFEHLISAIPHAEMIRQASHSILVCGDKAIEKNESWLIQNCSASIQNILLAAYDLGVGSCWIAIHGLDEVVKSVQLKFNLPENILPIALISLGYPDEIISTNERFDKNKIHINKW